MAKVLSLALVLTAMPESGKIKPQMVECRENQRNDNSLAGVILSDKQLFK
jgi:hypothetical protein